MISGGRSWIYGTLRQLVSEVGTLDELHGVEQAPFPFADIVQSHDILVLQIGQGLGFQFESQAELTRFRVLSRRKIRPNDLESNHFDVRQFVARDRRNPFRLVREYRAKCNCQRCAAVLQVLSFQCFWS